MEKPVRTAARARYVLATNLRRLMQATPGLHTQKQLEAKAGIAQTSVSNMLAAARMQPDPNEPTIEYPLNPRLDQIERVAGAFGLAAWQILVDPETAGPQMADYLLGLRKPTPHNEPAQLRHDSPQYDTLVRRARSRQLG